MLKDEQKLSMLLLLKGEFMGNHKVSFQKQWLVFDLKVEEKKPWHYRNAEKDGKDWKSNLSRILALDLTKIGVFSRRGL